VDFNDSGIKSIKFEIAHEIPHGRNLPLQTKAWILDIHWILIQGQNYGTKSLTFGNS
jgi:hypothetical protein